MHKMKNLGLDRAHGSISAVWYRWRWCCGLFVIQTQGSEPVAAKQGNGAGEKHDLNGTVSTY